LGEERGTMEYGGALLSREDLAPAQWDYVALGHHHVAEQVAPNAWYSGSLEYLTPNPWGQLQDEQDRKLPGKGYLLVELPGARVTFRHIKGARRFLELPPIQGAGLAAKAIDQLIAEAVASAKPPIDDQVVRLVVYDVPRATAHDLDHAAIRQYKARALHFQLDLRKPEEPRPTGASLPGRRQTLSETVRDFLRRRPLDAELDREAFVQLGVEYLEGAGAAGAAGGERG
jgi:hypothetical protein